MPLRQIRSRLRFLNRRMTGRQLTRTFGLAFDGRVSRGQAGAPVPSRPTFCLAFFAARVLNFPSVSGSRQPIDHLHGGAGIPARANCNRRCCLIPVELDLGDIDLHSAQIGASAQMTVDCGCDRGLRVRRFTATGRGQKKTAKDDYDGNSQWVSPRGRNQHYRESQDARRTRHPIAPRLLRLVRSQCV